MSKWICLSCGYSHDRPAGECDKCKCRRLSPEREALVARSPVMSAETLISLAPTPHMSSGVSLFDRALDDGLSYGYSILLAGGEGSGKSTLAAQVAAAFSPAGVRGRSLIMTSEELARNVADRMNRINLPLHSVDIGADSMGESIFTSIADHKLLIVDSINGFSYQDQSCEFGPAAVALTKALHRWAKTNDAIVIIISQANKDGDQAGPRAISHCVDCTLQIDPAETEWIYGEGGVPGKNIIRRTLTTRKNRQGRAPISIDVILDERGMHL